MLVVLGLLVFGAWLLLSNTGVIPSVKVKDFEAHGLPIGLACIGAAAAIAIFWKISFKSGSDGNGYQFEAIVGDPVNHDIY